DQAARRDDVLAPEGPPCRPVASGTDRIEGRLSAGGDLPRSRREDRPPACAPRPEPGRPPAQPPAPGRPRPEGRLAAPPPSHPRTADRPARSPSPGLTDPTSTISTMTHCIAKIVDLVEQGRDDRR